jgi:hypothetical protein
VRRRTFLATVAASGAGGLAGCTLGADRTVEAGDTVELDAGRVTLGALAFQSSVVDDTTSPPTVHGDGGTGYVALQCDCREYDGAVTDLPFRVALGADRVADAASAHVAGAGDGQPRIAFPVPAGDALDARRTTGTDDVAASWAVVLTDVDGRERRYRFDDALRRRLRSPPDWRVAVDPPDAMPETGTARAWATATNAGDTDGRLAALLTHDEADELYWTHAFDVPAGTESTFGYRFACLCGDRDELAITVDWGRDRWTGTISVES